jgi:integrase
LTLRWADADFDARSLLVGRNLSAGVETEPKGRRNRYVPLPDPALSALARLGARDEFIGEDDYVVCNRWGRRLDEVVHVRAAHAHRPGVLHHQQATANPCRKHST